MTVSQYSVWWLTGRPESKLDKVMINVFSFFTFLAQKILSGK